MYSGWSPFLSTKFWKKELVGRGEESRWGAKKAEGSGRTEEFDAGKRKGARCPPAMADGGDGGEAGEVGGDPGGCCG